MVISIFVIPDDGAGVVVAGVVMALHQATHATLRALGDRLAHLTLSPAEQNVLAVLGDGRRPVGDLAAATGTRPTTLTSVLDRLAARQLITRELDPNDWRSFLVALTPAGHRTARVVRDAVAELERHALSSLTAAQIDGFRAVARALTEVH